MTPKIVSPKEWLDARVSLLAKEKELTRLHDELAEQRKQLPWVRVEKSYTFEGATGKVSLSELFGDKTQLAGRFQLEAAVQSAHVDRLRGGDVSWTQIIVLYEGLIRIAPTLGALLGKIAAVAEAHGPAAALPLLDALREEDVREHQPYWAVRTHLLHALARTHEAQAALQNALALTEDGAVRTFLIRSYQQRV